MDNGSTVAGLNLLAPGFVDVGLTSIKLNGLKITNTTGGEVGTGACVINLIDGDGNTLKSYSWVSSGRGSAKTWGWKEGSVTVGDDVILARGAGILFTAQNTADIVKSAGEVNLEGVSFGDTVAGLNVIANPIPAAVKLNTLTVTSASDGEVGTGACVINLIDGDGNTLKSYSWVSSGRGSAKTWGWKEGSVAVGDDVVLAAGQAILFTAQNTGDKLIFPAQE